MMGNASVRKKGRKALGASGSKGQLCDFLQVGQGSYINFWKETPWFVVIDLEDFLELTIWVRFNGMNGAQGPSELWFAGGQCQFPPPLS